MLDDLFITKKIHFYTLKEFLKILLILIYGIFMLVFLIDLLEFSSKIQKYNLDLFTSIKIIFYRVPILLESVFQFIILISSILTLTKISSTSELTIIYSCKKSLWSVLKQQAVFVFIFGIINIFCLNPFFINMSKTSRLLEMKMIEKEDSEYLTSRSGIWFNQISGDEEIIFRASKAYVDSLLFKDVILTKIVDNKFIARIDASSMYLNEKDKEFILKDTFITEKDKNIDFKEHYSINTRLTKELLVQRIQNEYQNIDAIPFLKLHNMIKNFKKSGLETKKFVLKEVNYLLSPFIFVLMVLISGIFASSLNNRSENKFLIILKTILSGLVIFITQNVLLELGNAGIISIAFSSIIPIIFLYLIVIILLINKIELQNY